MTLIEQMTLAKVQEVFKEKNYAFFTKGNYNLNIIGVRSPNQVANSFDDYMLVIYKKNNNINGKKKNNKNTNKTII